MSTTPILGLTDMTEGQSAKHTTFNTAVLAIEKGTVIKLADGVTADMADGAAKTTLFTVPSGYKAVVTEVIVRQPTDTLGNDYDFGDGANADTWKQAVDLSGVGTTDYYVIRNDGADIAVFDAADVFGVKPAGSGAGSAAEASIDVFGYIFAV